MISSRRAFFGYLATPLLVGVPGLSGVEADRHIASGWTWPAAFAEVMPAPFSKMMMEDHVRLLLEVLQGDPPKGSTKAMTSQTIDDWNTLIIWKRNATNRYEPELGHVHSSTTTRIIGFRRV